MHDCRSFSLSTAFRRCLTEKWQTGKGEVGDRGALAIEALTQPARRAMIFGKKRCD
jgi:hypothetical protein